MTFTIRMTARELAGRAQELARSLAEQAQQLLDDYDGPEFEAMVAEAAETAERLAHFLQRAMPAPENVVPLRRPPVAIPPITPEALAGLYADLRADLGIEAAPEAPVVVSEETDDAREVQVAVAARRHGLQVERAPETEPPFDWRRSMKRVIVTRPFVGICHMQVCAVKDATDEEILEVCNRENRSGTTGGWAAVCRNTEPEELWGRTMPVPCEQEAGRLHFLVSC